MKLSVDKAEFCDLYCVYVYSKLWGWERYDTLMFKTYDQALEHAKNIKLLGN